MRLFDHFPTEGPPCPICGTNKDRPCFLMPIDGTGDGKICEARPTHADCLRDHADKFRLHAEMGLIYMRGAAIAARTEPPRGEG